MSTNVNTEAPVTEQTPKFGIGSGTALTSVIGLWIAFLTAAFNAGGDWYSDAGIQTMGISAAAAALAFLGLRLPRVQFGVQKATALHDEIVDRAKFAEEKYQELKAEYDAQMEEFRSIIGSIEAEQDTMPEEVADEVITEDPGNEATDTQAPR